MQQYITFEIGDTHFGVELECVQQVIEVPPRFVTVPRTPPFFLGMLNLRGEVIGCVHGRQRFGFEPQPSLFDAESQKLIVLETEHYSLGLLVDRMRSSLTEEFSELSPEPSELPEAFQSCLHGILPQREDHTVYILDPLKIMLSV